jgi:hypothetical protein
LLSPVLLVLLAAGSVSGNEGNAGMESTVSVQPDRPSTQTTKDAIDPCALVTKAEAEEALGAPVGEAEKPKEANIPPSLATCRYVAKSGQHVSVLTITVRIGSSPSESKSGFESTKEMFTGAQPVPGIGDDAFWFGDQLNVLKGKVYLIIGGVERDKAAALAQTALKRLK